MILRRGVHAGLLAALSQGGYPILFVYLDWPDAAVYAHSGVGSITWGGQTWLGVGTLGNITIPEEGSEIAVSEAVLALAGVPADLDGMVDDNIRNRTAEVYLGAVRARPGSNDGNSLIGTPVQLFSGLMDGINMADSATEDGVDHSVNIPIITGVEARSSASIEHSNEDQRRFYPSDTAGRLVILSYAKAQKITWPEN